MHNFFSQFVWFFRRLLIKYLVIKKTISSRLQSEQKTRLTGQGVVQAYDLNL